nr:hypothetical protein [Pyrinomonadaceae bacterium]
NFSKPSERFSEASERLSEASENRSEPLENRSKAFENRSEAFENRSEGSEIFSKAFASCKIGANFLKYGLFRFTRAILLPKFATDFNLLMRIRHKIPEIWNYLPLFVYTRKIHFRKLNPGKINE